MTQEVVDSDVVVVGGGVVGMSIATAMALRGRKVSLVERQSVGSGASCGNAGLVVPSYGVPLATSSNLIEGLTSLIHRNDTLRIARPLSLGILTWLIRFALSCTPGTVRASTRDLIELANRSAHLYESDSNGKDDFGLIPSGWLHIFRTKEGLRRAQRQAESLEKLGVQVEHYGSDEVLQREPSVKAGVEGAVYFPSDYRLVPALLLKSLTHRAAHAGVRIDENAEVVRFRTQGRQVQGVLTPSCEYRGDWVVLAAGAWTGQLTELLGLKLPLQPGKGCSLTLEIGDPKPRLPLMLGEHHVVVTPMPLGVRLTSGMEIGNFDIRPDSRQIDRMRLAVASYVTLGASTKEVSWAGLRPMLPDGMPVVGPARAYSNLVLAAGHASLGITLAPVTAELVADVIGGEGRLVPTALSPQRFGL